MKLELWGYPGPKLDGVIEWDPETGEIIGDMPFVNRVLRHIREVVASGGITTHPMPTYYKIRDPLHSLSEMAVVLGSVWACPIELRPYLPRQPKPPKLPPGGVF